MKILLTGGGTGGHIYPALAIGQYLKQQDPATELLYIGTDKGMESKIVPRTGIPFESIEITGFKRKLSYDNVRTVIRFLRGVSRSKQLIKQFKPDVVVGTGGYVCGPVVYAAARLGVPTFIHEQNAIPGLTNKFLTRYVSHVGVSFEDSLAAFAKAKQVSFTGNPCASQVLEAYPGRGRASLELEPNQRYALIVGGSRGAKALNEAVIAFAEEEELLQKLDSFVIVFATGETYYENTLEKLRGTAAFERGSIKLMPYINNMAEVLTDASIVVSRSGASSLAEITALGKPSILIPSPNVTNNHQEANARSLESVGAAEIILERELSGKALLERMAALLLDEHRLSKMSQASLFLAVPDSSNRIALALNRIRKNKR
ncbi:MULTISPECIES: undecaprenyldiphospho-muramoylpentapeptide beta-N-acetylglucosaminyltransferase [Paenibacillus]|uniref:undecaprenyldiphospho-muramoylpentapeptide beta-N-acetylglucosaminyltransferase n=1 Tax=Paenibacillus TaxID=44249 RepID=UPI00203E1B5A|nr:undecaprenyldiphospho-muramoylpentapeptide beta-N-acetylglucosaminyltransferase [Paenibacillus camelliae]MCM3632239.1 undecaprenyldiphospho-muramoylpentapeptide beta-N-acetylglucosaminyltransferase [Paenibacillus camelliae]